MLDIYYKYYLSVNIKIQTGKTRQKPSKIGKKFHTSPGLNFIQIFVLGTSQDVGVFPTSSEVKPIQIRASITSGDVGKYLKKLLTHYPGLVKLQTALALQLLVPLAHWSLS